MGGGGEAERKEGSVPRAGGQETILALPLTNLVTHTSVFTSLGKSVL